MLVLSRMTNERIQIGDNITITITEIRGDKVRIGIDAPKDVKVMRTELIGKPAAKSNKPDAYVPRGK
jgi:carbon storage regulator